MPVQVRRGFRKTDEPAQYCSCGERIYPQETGCYQCAITRWYMISGHDKVDRLIKFPKFTMEVSKHGQGLS